MATKTSKTVEPKNSQGAAQEPQGSQDEKKQEAQSQAQEEQTPSAGQKPQESAPADADAGQKEQGEAQEAPELLSLEELEMEFRVPSWQQAALIRNMGWASGKKVTRAEYESAMEALSGRRLGGGRC